MKKLIPAIVCAASFAFHAAAADNVKPCPELWKADSWSVRTEDAASLKLDSAQGERLRIVYSNKKDAPVQLLLKKPVLLEAGTDFTFRGVIREIMPTWLHCLVEDAKGEKFLFYTTSTASLRANPGHKGIFIGGRFGKGLERLGEQRFNVPGLLSMNRQHFASLNPKVSTPTPPLKIIGFQVEPEHKAPKQPGEIYLRAFALSRVNAENSAWYYQFEGKERFVELDGPPTLSLGDFGLTYGRSFVVDWELRDEYAGTPLLTGGKRFTLDPASPVPMVLQLGQDFSFPQPGPGTYWIRTKLRWSNRADGALERVEERDYRLFVISGKGAEMPKAAESGAGNIRFAPERKDLIWKNAERWNVSITLPAREGARKVILRALDGAGNELLKKEEAPTGATLAFDLSALKTDVCTVEVADHLGGVLVDRASRLMGREPKAAATAAKIPAGVPTARSIIDGPEPVFSIMPHVNDGPQKLRQTLDFMKLAPGVSRQVEYQFWWSECEPLPGIYDFSKLDTILEEAEKLNVTVLLWPSLSHYPEWFPSSYTKNDKGEIFGNTSYLFHGARPNLMFDPRLRTAAQKFLRQTAVHARSAKAVQGYYILLEHPGEAPYIGWYEGFDDFTIAGFRRFAEAKYKTVAKANAAWRQTFASFAALMPPKVSDTVVPQFRVDWLRYRAEAVRQFLLDGARTLREVDPVRLIMLYGDGIGGENLEDFSKLNVMTANGGCAAPEQSGLGLIRLATAGMPQRAEEISVGNWASFPYQLDASFFAMLMGGGSNANCKMFILVNRYLNSPQKNFDALRGGTAALDRYEKFMPLWRELRDTVRTGDDLRYYADREGHWVEDKTNFGAGGSDTWAIMGLMDSQILFGAAPASGWEKAKTVALLHRQLGYLAQAKIDALEAYVRNGGTLIMSAEAGRRAIENPDADWVLLRKLGFNAPTGDIQKSFRQKIVPVKGSIFPDVPLLGDLRDLYTAGEQPGTVAAKMADGRPAVTLKEHGKGKVAVLWAETFMPPSLSDPAAYPMMRSIAAWCGTPLTVETDSRHFWVNLLKKRSGDTWYLLVMNNNYGPAVTRTSPVRLPAIPEGTYTVSELVAETPARNVSAGELRKTGLPTTLEVRQLAIYKIMKIK